MFHLQHRDQVNASCAPPVSHSPHINRTHCKAVPASLSTYRHSLSTRSNSSTNNDAHSSCVYSDNSSLMLETRSSYNSTTGPYRQSTTFDSHSPALPSTPSLQQRHTLSDVSMYELSKTTAPASQHSSNSTFPECEGWIYKQSDRYKTWNKRWFVLHGTNLFYFKNSKVDGIAKLSLCTKYIEQLVFFSRIQE